MKKNLLKIISIIAAILIISVSLTSCGKSDLQIESEAKAAFDSIISAFKSGDSEKIKSYCISPESLGDNTEIKSAILASLGNIDYNIKSITVNDSKNASINTDITLIDSSEIMEKYIENIVSLVASEEYQGRLATMTREEYQALMDDEFQKVLNSDEIPVVTKNINVDLRLDNGVWKLNSSELTDLLVTNTVNAVSQIKQ